MCKILLFGGTTEGRQLSEFLADNHISTVVCTATAYGAGLSASSKEVRTAAERLNAEEMENLMKKEQPMLVIDATHPYAAEVTANIMRAAETSGIEYLRILRETEAAEPDSAESVYFSSIEEAAEWLNNRQGNILATTGSKEIQKYKEIQSWKERVHVRVLSTAESVDRCASLGFEGRNLIAMQGPFTKEMNIATIQAYNIRYLVTKDTGKSGGFAEKIEACRACGCVPVIIGRPHVESGISVAACKQKLIEKLNLRPPVEIALIGIGPGGIDTMTEEGVKALQEAEFVIGSGRMLDCARGKKPLLDAYRSEEIVEFIDTHRGYERFAVLFSGDTGFYSGAKKLWHALSKRNCGDSVRIMPGVSSVSYFAARLGTSWDDALITSNHGRQKALIPLIRDNEKVFSILGRSDDAAKLARKLVDFDMTDVRMTIGERLSYADERITSGIAKDFCDFRHDPLSVLLLENPNSLKTGINILHCRRDEDFLRGRVPMTKEKIRALSIDRLQLNEDAVCYDIGAGTGSVSVEMALRVPNGSVYAIERNPEAIKLLYENRRKFKADNLIVLEGLAPQAMEGLPPASHVFIGGSAGKMDVVIEAALEKLPDDKGGPIRFVINCIAAESTAQALACAKKYGSVEPEVTQISVAEGHAAGNYTLMKGENPITIISFDAEKR